MTRTRLTPRIDLVSPLASALLLASALWLTGCDFHAGDHYWSPTAPSAGGEVLGSGVLALERRPAAGVQRVIFSTVGTLRIERGSDQTLTLQADDNILPLLRSEVSGTTLHLWTEPGVSLRPRLPILLHLALPRLDGVELAGAGTVEASGFSGSILQLVTSGAGNMRIEGIDFSRLDVSMVGAGDIQATGTATEVHVAIAGVGSFLGRELACLRAFVAIPGHGTVTLRVRDRLMVDISGSGSVRFYGNPTVESTVTGIGDVVQAGG
jgi:hypothetical protein